MISVVMYIDRDMDLSENIWYILLENGIFNTWKLNNLSRTVFKSTKISELSCNKVPSITVSVMSWTWS